MGSSLRYVRIFNIDNERSNSEVDCVGRLTINKKKSADSLPPQPEASDVSEDLAIFPHGSGRSGTTEVS